MTRTKNSLSAQLKTPSFFIREDISEAQKIEQRRALLEKITGKSAPLAAFSFDVTQIAKHNCENVVGSVSIPVGVAGPVPIAVSLKKKETSVTHHKQVVFPLATTEGALVASIHRGARAVAAAGGAAAFVKKVGMSRAPVFLCKNAAAATAFISWAEQHEELFEMAACSTSAHLHFLSLTTYQKGNYVFLRVAFDTDEAMGMNMVSTALDYWWQHIVPKKITTTVEMIAISGNVCGDKKPAKLTRTLGRGYWVEVNAELSKEVLQNLLHVDAALLYRAHHAKNRVGSQVAGIPAPNMHVANAVAAFFAATGQDLAHVVDVASSASVRFKQKNGGIVVSLSMPSVPVGTIGGGTALPQQAGWLSQCNATKMTATDLAAFVATAALCGEISGLAALATHTLASAHTSRSRSTGKKESKESAA